LENQPALRGSLNQCAAVAEKQAAPVNQIVAVAKGAKGGLQNHRAQSRSFGGVLKVAALI
jgi:hypothetical protein